MQIMVNGSNVSRKSLNSSPDRQPVNMFPAKHSMYGDDSIICW